MGLLEADLFALEDLAGAVISSMRDKYRFLFSYSGGQVYGVDRAVSGPTDRRGAQSAALLQESRDITYISSRFACGVFLIDCL